MARIEVAPSGRESPFGEDEIIVSKTDLKGRITYANDVFLRVSAYSLNEVVGAPHSIIRHPEMPRCVFKLFWDTIAAGKEIFAYVLNMASNGDHYWVFAHVTPTFDASGHAVGYHSNRRKPDEAQIAAIAPLYRSLWEMEQGARGRKDGMREASERLNSFLAEKGVAYDRFVFSL
ncbi:MAG TPA: PAS domain-containing protein [Parvibaculum sp.]|uniref:PAS domain-containing protein n=1 Tax=Parvibaculum sp. TaxID=2024848 RepID=UPI002BF42917|nr:PAS domain-containing protein [Parvibaculum sp.]HMM15452.1 PAS domain-containing protein [Parvibaculum sp.]